ncbi:MAG TPA: FAD-dependent monooxygenase [Bacteroidia bacterium]|jgi:2-polyprenyl-6-methoxyphenol hydroxylase-like FAD-dependent oxidoreductase|nr:FAD-dependent monooxygenase [Bacteroidia bacterium]
MKKSALVSGASIAGLTMAYWLSHYGYSVTIVEISDGLRKGGASLDVRGDAIKIAERMGILDKIKAKKITTAVEFVDAKNNCIARLKNFGGDELHQDIELNRDHLVEILYEVASQHIEYLFNNRIRTINQDDNKVSVTFENGEQRDFDFVFGADGIHSSVRKLIFAEEDVVLKFFGAYFAILKADDLLSKLNNGQMYNLPGKMAATSDKGNSMLLFRAPKLQYDYRNAAEFKKILMENFAGCGWKIPAILKAMNDSKDLYFDELSQVKMQSWTKGRVVLIGDAAYCAGFPTGMGTSLAMQGAAMLADELVANDDYNLAFSNYNNSFHPLVEAIQSTIVQGINFLVPETEEGIALRNKMVG